MTAVVPDVPAPRPPKLPKVDERTLDSGLRVLAVRRAGVPRFEARLRVPIARRRDAGDPARQRLLSATLLAGTSARDSLGIQQDLQRLGATLDVAVDTEELALSASGLSGALRDVLGLMGEVLTDAAFPADEVELERDRAVQELTIVRAQPDVIAQEAFLRRMYGGHAYGRYLATPEEVAAITPSGLRRYARQRVLPSGAALVVVGDLPTTRMLDEAERSLARWQGSASGVGLPAASRPSLGPIVLVDRPGAVQTNIRMGGPIPGRAAPDYAALAVANTAFGGYFSSRLVQNIREDKGYTYSPTSGMSLNAAASHFAVGADVATAVTGAALLEIRYELGRMATGALDDDELRSAKRYLQGTLAITGATQAGLAAQIARLLAYGLDVGELRRFPSAIEAVTAEEARAAAVAYMAPRKLVTVLVGDAEQVLPQLEALDDVTVGQ